MSATISIPTGSATAILAAIVRIVGGPTVDNVEIEVDRVTARRNSRSRAGWRNAPAGKLEATAGKVALVSARGAAAFRSVLRLVGAARAPRVGVVGGAGQVWVLRQGAAVQRHVPPNAQQGQAVAVAPGDWAAAQISAEIAAAV
jgi:hypothetical protein